MRRNLVYAAIAFLCAFQSLVTISVVGVARHLPGAGDFDREALGLVFGLSTFMGLVAGGITFGVAKIIRVKPSATEAPGLTRPVMITGACLIAVSIAASIAWALNLPEHPEAQPVMTNSASPAASESSGIAMTLALLCGALGYYWIKRRARTARIEAMSEEARHWIEGAIERRAVPVPSTGTVLIPKGETSLLGEPSSLLEQKTDSTRHYVGTRTKVIGVPLYVGRSHTTSRKILSNAGAGTLVLTDKGLMFASSSRTIAFKLSEIVSASPMLDALVVNSRTHAKPVIFTVRNPLLWALAIQQLATGTLTA